jgi:hypothetical protein
MFDTHSILKVGSVSVLSIDREYLIYRTLRWFSQFKYCQLFELYFIYMTLRCLPKVGFVHHFRHIQYKGRFEIWLWPDYFAPTSGEVKNSLSIHLLPIRLGGADLVEHSDIVTSLLLSGCLWPLY